MEWYLKVLRDYAVFSGRARRKEYWMFTLISTIVSVILSISDILLGWEFGEYNQFSVLSSIYMLLIALPNLAVGVRRLHDTDRSGWWLLVLLVPIIGPVALLIFFCLSGTRGTNRFGPDPL